MDNRIANLEGQVAALAARVLAIEGTMRAKAAARTPGQPCAHLGPKTGERVECPTCGKDPATGQRKKVSLFVFGCAVHGKCTPGRKVGDLASCAGCRDYKTTG
jgi:hypothetical protein